MRVPKGWELSQVGQVLSIKNNLRKPISQEERKKIQGIYPYYGPTKIQDYISQYEQDGEYALISEDGDHFLKYANISQTQLIRGKCTVNNHAHILESTEKCQAIWFYNFFRHRNITSYLSRQGTGRYKLNKATLEILPILVPPLHEQQKIAQIISTWDKAIEKLEALITAKQKRKKALMQQLLTGKSRFAGFNDDWETVKLKDISVKKSSNIAANKIEENEGDYKIYGASGVLKTIDFFTENDCYISIVKDGAGVGRTFLCEKETSVLGTMDIIKAKENVDLFYLYAILKQIDFACYVTGSTIPHIYFKDYSKEKIKLPSFKEQQKIASVLSTADKEIENHQKHLAALKQQKQGLMQQLLTGKKRVKVEA